MIELNGRTDKNDPINHFIDWMYPCVNDEKSYIVLEMSNVAATQPIRISFDTIRDGWVIEAFMSEDRYIHGKWIEKAFIKTEMPD